MKKMFSSTQFLLLFAAMFSLFIVACLKEQGDPNYLDTKNFSRTSSFAEGCRLTPIPGQTCNLASNINIVVTLPASGNRPGCLVKVTVDIMQCEAPDGTISLSFSNFRVGQLCPELIDYLNQLNSESEYSEALDILFYDLSILAEHQEVSILANQGINVIDVGFFSALCYKRCLYEGVPVTNLCGDMCCKRSTKYTVINGQTQVSEPTFEASGTSCGSDAGCNTPTVSSCMHTCGDPRNER